MELFTADGCAHDNGFIQLCTAKPWYEPGETITGSIYLRVTQPIMDAEGIELEVKGGGKNGFIRYWYEFEETGETDENGNPVRELKEKHEKLKKKQKFLSYKDTVASLPGEIQPGDYEIQFSAELPGKIPSSFHFKDSGNREKPTAKIKYYCKAVLKCADEDHNMKHKQVLSIREKAVELQTDQKISETSELKTWGCCAQGTSSLEAEFNKNVFTPQETAEGELKIDNS